MQPIVRRTVTEHAEQPIRILESWFDWQLGEFAEFFCVPVTQVGAEESIVCIPTEQ